MKLYNIFSAMLVCLITACAPQKEIFHEQVLVHDGSTSPNNNNGGTDSGGGNGFKGKPLESYRFDVNALSEFHSVSGIIHQVLQALPQLAGEMWHVSQSRRWYKIPANLDVIPSERIGVAFATDQLALQNLNEIWINDNSFTAMTDPSDRSLLVLHEVVMGVRLMAFQDDLEKCLAKVEASGLLAKTSDDKSKYQSARKQCFHKYGLSRGNGLHDVVPATDEDRISLSKEDYENIRYLVTELWSSQGQVDGDELRDWLKAKGFRQY